MTYSASGMGAPRFVKLIGAAIGVGHPADSFATALPSRLSPIVLGGCGRSGTTLFRMMLDSHRRHLLRPGIERIPQEGARP